MYSFLLVFLSAASSSVISGTRTWRIQTGFFISALPCFLRFFNAASHQFHIGHDQFQIDGLHIPLGIRGAFHMDHVFIIETAHHMDDGVRRTDVVQKLIAQTFSLGCAFHQSGNIHTVTMPTLGSMVQNG